MAPVARCWSPLSQLDLQRTKLADVTDFAIDGTFAVRWFQREIGFRVTDLTVSMSHTFNAAFHSLFAYPKPHFWLCSRGAAPQDMYQSIPHLAHRLLSLALDA